MALDAAKNFAKSAVSTGYNSAATSIVLATGGGAKFPAAPFNAVWYNTDYADPGDDPSVEVIRVTVKSTDTLTITRAQEGTSAANHNTAGKTYVLVAGPTAKLMDDLGGVTDDTTTNATMYPIWATGVSGNLAKYASSTKLSWNPSTGILTAAGNYAVSKATGSTYFTNAGYVGTTTDTATSNTTHKVSPYIALYGSIWNGSAAQTKGIFAQVGGIGGTNTAYQLNFASTDASDILVLRGDSANVGIRTNNPQAPLHVKSGASGATILYGPEFVVESAGNSVTKLLCPSTGTSYLCFGNEVNDQSAMIFYTHSNATLNFSANAGSYPMYLSNTGCLGLGVAPTAKLTVLSARSDINANNNATFADSTTMAANVGGGLSFRGKYTAAGAYTEFASIHAYKDNATDGNYSAGLAFYTRSNGTGGWTVLGASGPASAGYTMKLDSAGAMTVYSHVVSTAGVFQGAGFNVTGYASQYSAYFNLRGSAQSQLEWGHSNTGGYGSTIGAENSSGNPYIAFQAGKGTNNNTYKTFGLVGMILKTDTTGNLWIGTAANSNADNQTLSTKMIIGASGSVIIGDNVAALATNATAGFLYIPTCAGAPTGVPTAINGTKAIVYDTTNNNLYLYNGAWKKVGMA